MNRQLLVVWTFLLPSTNSSNAAARMALAAIAAVLKQAWLPVRCALYAVPAARPASPLSSLYSGRYVDMSNMFVSSQMTTIDNRGINLSLSIVWGSDAYSIKVVTAAASV